jgi:hypothetical protein
MNRNSSVMFSSIVELWPWRKPRESHPCILVGDVYDGKSTSPLSRRVIFVNLNDCSVETRDVIAVKEWKGKVTEVHSLGRVTVPVLGHLKLVEGWIKETIGKKAGVLSMEVILDDLKAHISELGSSPAPEVTATVTLEIFEGTIVNHTKDRVFGPVRDPSSSL